MRRFEILMRNRKKCEADIVNLNINLSNKRNINSMVNKTKPQYNNLSIAQIAKY